MSRAGKKNLKKFALNIIVCSVILFVALELFFRFVMPASEWPRSIVNESGVRQFDPNYLSTGYWTYGRYCEGHFLWSINSQGWNSIYDYRTSTYRETPMVAILGDSYLQGFYSDVDKHIDVYLTEQFQDSVSFYTFAMASGILSQYIAWMKYEIDQYSPDAFIIFVNSQDVLGSFREIGERHPFYYQYSCDSAGMYTELAPITSDNVSNGMLLFVKDVAQSSAFFRYLRSNAQITSTGGGVRDENANFVEGGVESSQISQLENIDLAYFLLSEISSFGKPVLIVADCPKHWIYNDTPEIVWDDIAILIEAATMYSNITVFELKNVYISAYNKDGRMFSVKNNPHWDAYTNRLVARGISDSVCELLAQSIK